MFQSVALDDPNIDEYWKEQILYVKNFNNDDARYVVDTTYLRGRTYMAPSKYRLGDYEYALRMEE